MSDSDNSKDIQNSGGDTLSDSDNSKDIQNSGKKSKFKLSVSSIITTVVGVTLTAMFACFGWAGYSMGVIKSEGQREIAGHVLEVF